MGCRQQWAVVAGGAESSGDLNSVRDDLATVVGQALAPAHVSVWLTRAGDRGGGQPARWLAISASPSPQPATGLAGRNAVPFRVWSSMGVARNISWPVGPMK